MIMLYEGHDITYSPIRMVDGRKWPKFLAKITPPAKRSLQFATWNLLRPSSIVGDQAIR